jgi:phosphopantothenoylcysteine decarboxylase/phosphopantothenate--cysteine ligase
METRNMLENSRAKLERKHIDMIVANNLKVEGAGFGTDTNVVTLITRESETELPIMSKEEVADRLLTEILKRTKGQDCGINPRDGATETHGTQITE